MGEWIEVMGLEDIAADGSHALVGDEEILLVRQGNAVYALGYLCSHQDKELQGGECDAEAWLCPHHGARFDLKTGKALSMPAVEPISSYEVKVEQGRVFVREPRP
jgi:3-phenylpropionate/trans-cinnamate dioxygenase ferredoxin subunit